MKKLINYLNAENTLFKLSLEDFEKQSLGNEMILYNLISGFNNHFSQTIELAWKLQKDILIYSGVQEAITGSPKQILRLSYAYGIIDNKDIWLEMINERNNAAHIYDRESICVLKEKIISMYIPSLDNFARTVIRKVFELYENNDIPAQEIDNELLTVLGIDIKDSCEKKLDSNNNSSNVDDIIFPNQTSGRK